MKIIKIYPKGNMKHIQYDGSDAEVLKERFTKLTHETIDKLCQWLHEHNEIIDADDCYDAQSGWYGTEFRIGNADLSSNGYCLNNEAVELFLNGGQNPNWYHSWQPEYEEAVKWVKANREKK